MTRFRDLLTYDQASTPGNEQRRASEGLADAVARSRLRWWKGSKVAPSQGKSILLVVAPFSQCDLTLLDLLEERLHAGQPSVPIYVANLQDYATAEQLSADFPGIGAAPQTPIVAICDSGLPQTVACGKKARDMAAQELGLSADELSRRIIAESPSYVNSTAERAVPLIEALSTRLITFLKEMDAEATTVLKDTGQPAGLENYAWHRRPTSAKPRNEVAWSTRLAELLPDATTTAEPERAYPNQRKKHCDLFVIQDGHSKLWLEIKGAWRSYWGGNSKIYRSYLFHPLLPNLDKTKTHTVPLDLAKLSTLRPPEADYIAELLLGFEKINDPMDSDIDTLVRIAKLDQWHAAKPTSWLSPTVPDLRVQFRLWYRPADVKWELPPPVPA